MKITMYELLGMVKDGKAPKKVIYDGNLWEFNKVFNQYQTKKAGGNLWNGYNFNILNDEVEIIEGTPTVQVEMTQEEYFKYLDEQQKYMEQVKNYKQKPSYLKIEEEKKTPEKLEIYKEVDDEDHFANILKVSKNGECEIDEATSVIVDKINEVIDYLEYLKIKGE